MSEVVAEDGVTIHYDVFGRRDGPPLLMIQGLGTDSRGWALQRLAFGRKYRCYTLDNRGTGRSDRPPARTRSTRWRSTRSRCSTPRASTGRT